MSTADRIMMVILMVVGSTVRDLKIPKDILQVLEKIVASNNIQDRTKHLTIRKLTGVSPCCICDGIPAFEVSYSRT